MKVVKVTLYTNSFVIKNTAFMDIAKLYHKRVLVISYSKRRSLLDFLQVLLKESSSRNWLLFEYNDWTEPNEWFTIQGIQSINSLILP